MKYRTAIVIETSRPPFSCDVKYRTNDVAEHKAKVLSFATYSKMIDQLDSDIDFNSIKTLDQDYTELLEIEMELMEELNLDCHLDGVRAKLVELDRKNELVENELVMRWYDVFASYKSELEYQLKQLNDLLKRE